MKRDEAVVVELPSRVVAATPRITVRRAVAGDASAIGAVFDAAVRAGWGYLGDLVDEPMFRSEDWDHLVADHMPPNVLLVATDEAGGVVGIRPSIRMMVRCSSSLCILLTPVWGLVEGF